MGHAEFTLASRPGAAPLSLDEYWMPFTPNRDFKHDPKMVVRAEGMYCGTTAATSSSTRRRACSASTPATAGRRSPTPWHASSRELDFIAPFTARASEAVRARHARRRAHAGRPQPHLLRQLGLRGGRHGDEDRARLPPGARPGRPQRCSSRASAPTTASTSAASRSSGMVNNRRKFGADAARHRAHAPHAPQGKPASRRAKARTAPSSPRTCCASSTSTARRTSPPASSSRSPARPAASCRRRATSKRLREICDAHGILLVFDEVITGFGRTGQAFAAQSFGVTPDLMTMAKGLTNGAQPMGAVAISRAHPRHDHGRGAGRRDRVLPRLHVLGPSRPRARPGSRRSTSTGTKACSSAARAVAVLPRRASSRCRTCRSSPTSAATG